MAGDRNAEQGDAGLGLDDEDRLPWLEAADGFEEDGEVSPARLLVMVLGGLLLIGVVLGGLWWVQNGGARGKGELIAAQQGDYKVAPKNDGAKAFEGEGDASFSASEGAEPAGRVDPTRMPEEPAATPRRRRHGRTCRSALPIWLSSINRCRPRKSATAPFTGCASRQGQPPMPRICAENCALPVKIASSFADSARLAADSVGANPPPWHGCRLVIA